MTLPEFLLARIAEDAAAGQNALALHGSGTHHPLGHPLDPARVLAECKAKRNIVEEATGQHTSSVEGYNILGIMATVYADHPDYRNEWRP